MKRFHIIKFFFLIAMFLHVQNAFAWEGTRHTIYVDRCGGCFSFKHPFVGDCEYTISYPDPVRYPPNIQSVQVGSESTTVCLGFYPFSDISDEGGACVVSIIPNNPSYPLVTIYIFQSAW